MFSCGVLFSSHFGALRSCPDANDTRRSVVDCWWLSGCGQGPVFLLKRRKNCLLKMLLMMACIACFLDLTNLLSSHTCTDYTSCVYIHYIYNM